MSFDPPFESHTERPFDYPDRCPHPHRGREMICSACGVLLHDSASVIGPGRWGNA